MTINYILALFPFLINNYFYTVSYKLMDDGELRAQKSEQNLFISDDGHLEGQYFDCSEKGSYCVKLKDSGLDVLFLFASSALFKVENIPLGNVKVKVGSLVY